MASVWSTVRDDPAVIFERQEDPARGRVLAAP